MLVESSDLSRRERDQALVEAHCAGDPRAFPVIVGDHYQPLLAQAHRRLGSRVEAEDAVQETFERAYRGLCRVAGEYRLGAWLSRIVANVCTDHAARRQVQRALPARVGGRFTEVADVSEHASDPTVLRAVRAALDALPAKQRQTFLLYEMDGLSYPEVAHKLGITEDNARARVHRAKTALRRSLVRTRDAVAALIALPFGIRALLRNGHKLSGSRTMAQIASAGPVSDLAVSVSSGPNPFVVLTAGVVTVIGGALAAPVVTGSSASTNATTAVVSTPSARNEASTDTSGDDSSSPVPSTTSPPVANPSSSRDSVSIDTAIASWITTGAEAPAASPDTEAPGAVPGTDTSDPPAEVPDDALPPDAAPSVDPCPWLRAYPDIVASLPGAAPVMGTLPSIGGNADSPLSINLASSTTLRVVDAAGTWTSVPVTLRAQACLETGRSAIVIDLEDADGNRAQLRGALVMKLNDDYSLFRGSVSRLAGGPGLALPWGLPDRFVTQLELHPDSHTASIETAFLGGASKTTGTSSTH